MRKLRNDVSLRPEIRRMRKKMVARAKRDCVYERATEIVKKLGYLDKNLIDDPRIINWREFSWWPIIGLKIRQKTRPMAGDIAISVYWQNEEVFSASCFDPRRPADVIPDYLISRGQAIKVHRFRLGQWLALLDLSLMKKFDNDRLRAEIETIRNSLPTNGLTTVEFEIVNNFQP